MWEKYGQVLADYTQYHDPKTGANFPRSPITMSDRVDLPSRGHTLASNAARGVQYAVCSRATRNLATFLAAATGGEVDAIARELAASIGVNARMVPAGVMATTRAQERGYTMLVAG
jgi:intracellular sulfur oxidation DsrE/DsrF family protein